MIIEELELRTVLNYKQLERDNLFLIYLSRTYRSMIPYLKGIHLSLDSWREGSDMNGWKNSRRYLLLMMCEEGIENEVAEDIDARKDNFDQNRTIISHYRSCLNR